jgi:hypothetical protein
VVATKRSDDPTGQTPPGDHVPPRYPPVPLGWARAAKIAAWVLLACIAVPSVVLLARLLVVWTSGLDVDPTGLVSIYGSFFLFLLLIPLVAMILITLGLYRGIRDSYAGLAVGGPLSAIVLVGTAWYVSWSWLAVSWLIAWAVLDVIGAAIGIVCLRLTRAPLPTDD